MAQAIVLVDQTVPDELHGEVEAAATALGWKSSPAGPDPVDAPSVLVTFVGEGAGNRGDATAGRGTTVVVSASADPRLLAALLDAGAAAVLVWPRDRLLLGPTLRRAGRTAILSAEEAFLRRIIDLDANPLIVKDREGNYRFVNEAAARFYGMSREALLGNTIESRQPPGIAAEIRGKDEKVLETGISHPFEMTVDAPGGRRIMRALKTRTLDVHGAPVVVTFLQDVTEQRAAEAQRDEQRQLFRLTLDASPNPILVKDMEGNLVVANRATAAIYGRTVEEVTGRNLREIHPNQAEAAAYLESDRRAVVAGTGEVTVEHSFTAPGAEPRHFLSTRRGFHSLDGRQLVLNIATDITERKRIEEVMEHTARQAIEASRAKSQFLANMRHEIRTPLNGILGMTELVLSTGPTGDVLEFIQATRTSGQLLLTLVNQILDLSKIESGKVTLDVAPFSFGATIAAVTRALELKSASKGVAFRVELDEDLPATLLGDRLRLQQILLNLLGNSVKFTEAGYVRLRARPSRQSPHHVHLSVEDTGIGISPDQMARIFDPFTQADQSTTRRYGGTGLGLTIARALVDLMKGRLWAESVEGQGTTFHVELPLIPASMEDAPSSSPPLPPSAPPPRAGSGALRILLAEDNDINARIVQVVLAKAGHEVVWVRDGEQALSASDRQRFDAILMDVHMPNLDGLAATRAIRAREESRGQGRTHIIALTASAMKEDADLCFEAGMDCHLTKPLSMAELGAALGRVGEAGADEARPGASGRRATSTSA